MKTAHAVALSAVLDERSVSGLDDLEREAFSVLVAMGVASDVHGLVQINAKAVTYTASPQRGRPGHCFAAQVFKGGHVVATFEATIDPAKATRRAHLCAAILSHDAVREGGDASVYL